MSRQIVWSAFLIASFSSSGYSSTAVAVITSQGIVLGTDDKVVTRCEAPCPLGQESPKIAFLHDRVAVATVGLYAIIGRSHMVAPYYFPSLVGQIKTRLTNDPAVSQVSAVLEMEARRVFLWFDQYLRLGIVKQSDFPEENPVEYLIAGYQAGVPAIYSVYVEVDWHQSRLNGVHRVQMHPKAGDAEHLLIYGIGSNRVLRQIIDEHGALYRKLLSKAPLESRMLIARKQLSLKQAGDLLRAVLEVEAFANPDHVSPPFTIVTIPKDASSR